MLKNQSVIYALDKRINAMSVGDRVSMVRRALMKIGCQELENREVLETDFEGRKAMLHLLARYAARPLDDPIIAVPTWQEIKHPEVATKILEGGFSVIVANKAQDFEKSLRKGGYICNGPALDHVVEYRSKLKSYVDGLGHAETSEKNKRRAGKAREFADHMWPHIEAAAQALKTTVQAEIAKYLTEQGFKSVEGGEISRSQVGRYIKRATKGFEWKALEESLKASAQPDLFMAKK